MNIYRITYTDAYTGHARIGGPTVVATSDYDAETKFRAMTLAVGAVYTDIAAERVR